MYTIHTTGDGYKIMRWVDGEVGPRALYTAYFETIEKARDVVPAGLTCREREHYDLPSLVESWHDPCTRCTDLYSDAEVVSD